MRRYKLEVNGIVQGVGFRPFVFNLANKLNLSGHVRNDSKGVIIEIEGDELNCADFIKDLKTEKPALAQIVSLKQNLIDKQNEDSFKILESSKESKAATFISPDLALCPDCLGELFDKNDRRYRYPFINCTNCGPRFTIVENIPYDRPKTSMKIFKMCPECQAEYDNPRDRRFHAQPNGCHDCGPKLWLSDGKDVIESDDPIDETIELLKKGNIVAIKGIGGFHLACDPFNKKGVELLRQRKGRAEKPFALMAKNIETVKKYCSVSEEEEDALNSYIAPIVLLEKRENDELSTLIASDNNFLGMMIPYTPLHHLLFSDELELLIMTSANFSEEPIAIKNDEAIERLSGIADYLLLNDREILKRCDDSIVTYKTGSAQIIRRSRGFVPAPIFVNQAISQPILAVGGELKNSIALSRDDAVFLSQYIGDLDNPSAFSFFEETIEHMEKILEIKPEAIVCDHHPEYLSTKWAKDQNLPLIAVQHHHAHMASVMADNNYNDPVIGLILDGTGFGLDNTIWGGEILVGDYKDFSRKAWLKPVAMPGGTKAIKEPYRMTLSYLYQIFERELPDDLDFLKGIPKKNIDTIFEMIEKDFNSVKTSSCGRLFDAVAALLNIKSKINYDAQAAILLEKKAEAGKMLPLFEIAPTFGEINVDNMIIQIIEFLKEGKSSEDIALYFHHQLVEYFIASLNIISDETSLKTVALSGGVFMNGIFTKIIRQRLTDEGYQILIHKNVPTNDGGIALGQIMIADAQLN